MKPINIVNDVALRTGRQEVDILAESTNPAPAILVNGLLKSWVHLRLKWTLLQVIYSCYKNPADWFGALRYLIRLRRSILGNFRVRKMVKINGLYYMGLYTPGWNDSTYRRFIASELYHYKAHKKPVNRFNQVFLAITKKCPLRCDHCSAWDTLNQRDELGLAEFTKILDQVSSQGATQIYFTGGEPLVRLKVLLPLIRQLPGHTKSWLSTSGFQFTAEKAKQLKDAGLTGVFVSLDHYKAEKHNSFRHYEHAYSWALRAAHNAREAGLVVAFSICLSNAICTKEELMKYMTLARESQVHFVQFFEPQAVGHYKDKAVSLSRQAMATAEAVYLEMNFGKKHLDYPIISYHGYYKRRVGCFGAGKRTLYIDADGNLNACPFCQKNYGNLLEGGLKEKVRSMAESGCPTN